VSVCLSVNSPAAVRYDVVAEGHRPRLPAMQPPA